MADRYFIWNGVNSSGMHIIMNDRAPIIRPEERVNHITIPGRMGELTQVEGDDVFNSYIQTLAMTVQGKANVPAAENWLRGEGVVTFDTQPDLQQKARVINAVTFQRHSRNADYYTGDVQFYCEPVKRLIDEESIEVTSSGTTLTNPGMLKALPLMEITGSGAVSITINGTTLIIPECESGWVADCENKWILDDGVPQFGAWQGEFPDIPAVGSSTITFTGSITKIKITPRWRYL